MADIKSKIIDALNVLIRRDSAEKKVFQVRAYKKVIEELQALEKPIVKLENIDGIPGIGKKIREKIGEILATGVLKAAEKAKEDLALDAVEVLSGVYGFGPAKAGTLIADGIKTIAQLRSASEKDPNLLNRSQKIGLKYYDDILQRIPRAEMKNHEKILTKELYVGQEGSVVGSFRRGQESSGDIDFLIKMDPGPDKKEIFQEYVKDLIKSGYMIEVLSQGDQKCLAVVRLTPELPARRLDILVIPTAQFPYALLYFTGSGEFNIAFRKHALKLGYSLNEHEMKLTGKVPDAKPVPAMTSEADIFAFLGLKYKEPNERVAGAVELKAVRN
jgi:DNA polymerase/3'-5' exonuclease PolX